MCSRINSRDFRLIIGNPSDPRKGMANPVFWFMTEVITEVNCIISE
jgi:hypothetical protein